MTCKSYLIKLSITALFAFAATTACIHEPDDSTDDGDGILVPALPLDNDETPDDNSDDDSDDDNSEHCDDGGDDVSAPALQCDVATAGPEEMCGCMARIVCDQIYFCLDAEELAAKPEYWSPYATCVEELESDCLDDAGDPDYAPSDFPLCLTDIAAAECTDFGLFESVSQDFPASCENLRALDTGLSIAL